MDTFTQAETCPDLQGDMLWSPEGQALPVAQVQQGTTL